MTPINANLRGQVLKQVYRVWLFRKLLPVLVVEILVLVLILYKLGQVIFFQRILENALKVFFINPSQIISFVVSAFVEAPWATRILGFAVLVLVALLLRHITQGILRLILVRENYFGKVR
jgi:hypothetical protein